MKISCPSCGASLPSGTAKCPYCGSLFAEGAEREHMQKLYTIQKELVGLHETPVEGLKTEIRRQGRFLRRALLVAALLAALLALLLFFSARSYERDHTADYIWQQQHLPHMTELYEAGDYEALAPLFLQALEEDRPVWTWEYCDAFWEILEEMEE